MRVVSFFRVSTDKQVESGLGLEAQQTAVKALCDRQGWEIVSSHTEEAVSGKTPFLQREGLLSAIHDVGRFDADALVVAKLDRLGRDGLVLMTIERELARLGARIVSASGEGTDSDDPSQVLVRRIMSAVAENELAMVSLRTRSAMKAKKERGEVVGRPPFGFCISEGQLAPGQHFNQVIKVLELRRKLPGVKRMTLQQIAEKMNSEQDDVVWSVDKVHRIVSRWKSPTMVKRHLAKAC